MLTSVPALLCQHCHAPVTPDQTFCGRCGKPVTPDPDLAADEVGNAPPTTRRSVLKTELLEGKWRLESKLGEGGMGAVYLAHDLTLDRKVAIKLLGKQFTEDAELVARFEREGRLTASLEHPNIVPIYAVGRAEDRPFLVMKVLEGQTLLALTRSRGHLELDDMLGILRQLCSGLGFIHARGFIHRDIKSANIFVSSEGHATLLDFGIVRPQQGNNPDSLTRPGMVVGTPQYMSPEQSLGMEVDHRADLYALAVVLYESLTGELPYSGDNELSVIQMHAHAPIPDASAKAPWLSEDISRMIRKGLAKRPDDRYQNAAELLEAFEVAVLGDAQALAMPRRMTPVPGGPGTAISQRRQRELEQRSSGPKPMLTPPAVAAPSNPHAHSPRDADEPAMDTAEMVRALRSKRRSRLGVLVLLGLALVAAAGYFSWRKTPSPVLGAVTPPVTPAQAVDAGLASAASEGDAGAVAEDEGSRDGGAEVSQVEETTSEDPETSSNTAATSTNAASKHGAKGAHKKTGRVNVITLNHGEPFWAAVSVNGAHRGNTPLLLELPPGKHRLRVERTGFVPVERQIRVNAGQSVTLRIALRP